MMSMEDFSRVIADMVPVCASDNKSLGDPQQTPCWFTKPP